MQVQDLYLQKKLIQGTKDCYTMEKRYFHKNGQIVYIIIAVSMVKDNEGYTALHWAIYKEYADIVGLFLSKMDDISAIDHNSYSLLHLAGQTGSVRNVITRAQEEPAVSSATRTD